MGLTYPICPHAMRRTFQDLAREAAVADVVTRAIVASKRKGRGRSPGLSRLNYLVGAVGFEPTTFTV